MGQFFEQVLEFLGFIGSSYLFELLHELVDELAQVLLTFFGGFIHLLHGLFPLSSKLFLFLGPVDFVDILFHVVDKLGGCAPPLRRSSALSEITCRRTRAHGHELEAPIGTLDARTIGEGFGAVVEHVGLEVAPPVLFLDRERCRFRQIGQNFQR